VKLKQLKTKITWILFTLVYPLDAAEGTEPRIQLDDQLALDYSQVGPWKMTKTREGYAVHELVTSLKVHRGCGMRNCVKYQRRVKKY